MALFKKKKTDPATCSVAEAIGPMKRKKSALLTIILVPVIGFAVIFGIIMLSIYLPPSEFDPAMEQVIRESLEKPADEPLTRTDLKMISYLNASGRGIQDLRGMSQLVQLRVLVLQDNPITDLSPLKTLPVLSLVDVRGCPITDYSVLDTIKYVYK